MASIESYLEQLQPLRGKKLFIGKGHPLYFLKETDFKLPFMNTLSQQLQLSDDEYGDELEMENYRIIACNGITPLEGKIVFGEIDEIYLINLETLKIIKIRECYHELTYESLDLFLSEILVKNGSSRVYL